MIANYFRFGWRRRVLLKICGRLPAGRAQDRLLDFLYPEEIEVTFR